MVICQLLPNAQIVCNNTDLCLSKIFMHCITFVILFMVTSVETCGYLCYFILPLDNYSLKIGNSCFVNKIS